MTTAEERLKIAQDKDTRHNRLVLKAKAMWGNGYPVGEIAEDLGVSEATVLNLVKGL